jgi:Leucine-rich repeat (LRR) protein
MFIFNLTLKKTFTAVIITILSSLQLNAQLVSPELAQKVAVNFYNSQIQTKDSLKSAGIAKISLAKVYYNENMLKSANDEKKPLCYVFNLNDNGFIIVTADERFKPIIGYSEKSNFSLENKPAAFISFFNSLYYQINYAVSNNLPLSKNNEWLKLKSNKLSVSSKVGPLMNKIMWGQGKPYNNKLFEKYSERTSMGCTAIALAQLMYYYKYPFKGIGEFTYDEAGSDPQIGTITAKFDDNIYQWENFKNSYSSNETELANMPELILETAMAIESDFGTGGTGSRLIRIGKNDVVDALKEIFRYKGVKYKSVDALTKLDNWENTIRNEIDQKRPVLYGFTDQENDTIKHALICDGYNNDLFHFNWGWDGHYNNDIPDYWFPLTAIEIGDRDYSYESNLLGLNTHQMIINIAPDYENPLKDQYEQDNNFADATLLENGKPQLHSISPEYDKDYYKFVLTSPANVTIETNGVNGNTQMWLYDGNQQYFDYDDDSGEGSNSKLVKELQKGTYYVMIEEKGGDTNIPSYVISLNVTETGLPNTLDAPTVTVSKGTYSDHIFVSWSEIAEATGYNLYRSTSNNSANAVKIGQASSTYREHEDRDVEPGITYYYWVKTLSKNNDVVITSDFSNVASGWLKENENHPPNEPTLISPENNSTVTAPFTLQWDCSDPDGDDLTYKLKVYHVDSDDGNYEEGITETYLDVSEELREDELGTYEWSIFASDGEYEVESDTWTFTIVSGDEENYPPVFTNSPNPPDNSIVGLGNYRMSWECADADNDPLTFNLFAREKDDNYWERPAADLDEPYFDAFFDNPGDVIEWKVIASDGKVEVESPIWTFTVQKNINGVNENDSLALVALYNSCDGDNWSNNTNWLEAPVKDWYGVTVKNGRVTSLKLNASYPDLFGLKNNLPPEIGQLTNLDFLDLSFNELTGPIPPEIGNLTNLRVLQLTSNKLSGNIPPEVGNLHSLTHLILADNELSGNIPPEIGDLQNLQTLMITYNQLSGTIPEEIGNLESLDNIHLYNNFLSGEIPSSIGNLTNLTYLGLSSNNLSGTIPSHLFDLNNLEKLIIAYNDFSGTFPEDISKLTSLNMLRIDRNKFSGKLTDKILQLPNLDDIWIEENNFTEIPNFSSKENIIRLKIFNNNLTFEDIEPNMPVLDIVNNSENQYAEFIYSPQKKIGEPISEQIEEEQEYTLSIDCGGEHNQYQWIKDGVILNEPTTNPEYIISSFSKEDEGFYMCKVTNSIVPDLIIESYTIALTAKDITSPTLSINPSTGSNLSNQFSISLIFSENVTGVAEGLSVNNGEFKVSGEGKNYTVTINTEDNMDVTLFISNNITDLAGNHFDGASYNYSVGDNTPPFLTACSPNDTIINDNHPTFNFSFNEEIVLGSGSLKVYKRNNNTISTLSIPFDASMIEENKVTVSYNSTINGSLEKNTEYYITIDDGSFADLSGNIFEGIEDNSIWTFTTGPNYATYIKNLNSIDNTIEIYPNPSSNKLTIEFTTVPQKYSIEFYNNLGQTVIQKQSANRLVQLNLRKLTNGIYYLKIYNGEFSRTEKIIVK